MEDLSCLVGVFRDVWVSIEAESLDQAKIFIAELEQRWDTRHDALRRSVEEEHIHAHPFSKAVWKYG